MVTRWYSSIVVIGHTKVIKCMGVAIAVPTIGKFPQMQNLLFFNNCQSWLWAAVSISITGMETDRKVWTALPCGSVADLSLYIMIKSP